MEYNIINFLKDLNPVLQAFIATFFTWGLTALGASIVIFTKRVNQKLLDTMLGFAAGVMIAASCWSLLVPSIEMAGEMGVPQWLPATVGFLAGGIFMRVVDQVLPHLHIGFPVNTAEGIKTSWQRSTLLVLAITLHNIPEGLAIGVAFGAIASGFESASLGAAVALAIGIGLQNFPEGMAVSLPLRREGFSRAKSLWYGQLSGAVEPVAGVLGAALILIFYPILPYALSFAAGAMIFVVVEELIPESQIGEHGDIATLGALIGFAVMMVLDVALS